MASLKLTQSRRAYGHRGFKGDQVFPRERETGCRDARGGYLKVVIRT